MGMWRHRAVLVGFALATELAFSQAIQSPEAFFGHRIGAEKKLARWDRIVDYMKLVDRESDRVLFQEVGKSTNGNAFVLMVNATHPIAYGLKYETNAYFANSLALEPVPSFSSMRSSIVVRYPNNNLLKSGWLQGESHLSNKVAVAEVRLGKGRMILIPLRVQHRAQTHATFKLLFNSILTSATENHQ